MSNKSLKPLELIDNDGQLIGEVFYKPHRAIIFGSITALLLAITRQPLAILLGVFVLALSLYVHYIIKDRKTLGVYDSYIIVYASDNPNLVRKISFDDIEEWDCKANENGVDAFMIKLIDQEVIYKDTFQLPKAFKLLRKVLPLKETRKIEEEKYKKKKLKFDNPLKYFKKKNQD